MFNIFIETIKRNGSKSQELNFSVQLLGSTSKRVRNVSQRISMSRFLSDVSQNRLIERFYKPVFIENEPKPSHRAFL